MAWGIVAILRRKMITLPRNSYHSMGKIDNPPWETIAIM
jgi:hypothetical protein